MPIYEYACRPCQKIYEKIKPVGTETIACPKCSGEAKKILSKPGMLRFKGSGWSTRRPVEAFEGESEYTDEWGQGDEDITEGG